METAILSTVLITPNPLVTKEVMTRARVAPAVMATVLSSVAALEAALLQVLELPAGAATHPQPSQNATCSAMHTRVLQDHLAVAEPAPAVVEANARSFKTRPAIATGERRAEEGAPDAVAMGPVLRVTARPA